MSDMTRDPDLSLPSPTGFRERDWGRDTPLEKVVRDLHGRARRLFSRRMLPRRNALTRAAARHEDRLRALTDGGLLEEIMRLRTRLLPVNRPATPSGEDMAILREVARRSLGLRAHDVQLIGASIVTSGRIAEMATGEGKTLVAGLAAAWRALTGMRVHVVTVNDYLAARDAEKLAPFYSFLGLRVGVITADTPAEARPRAYRCPVCYCTNKELAFDYLRQSAALRGRGGGLQRRIGELLDGSEGRGTIPGLEFAIVDEVDSVLVDEARTPLILSERGKANLSPEVLARVMDYARTLLPGRDIRPDPARWTVHLTEPVVRAFHLSFSHEMRGPLSIPRLREELLRQALMALHIYHPQEHYLIRDGKIGIVDEYTGRVMPDRSWRGGLHQMVEIKEGCEVTSPLETVASMTYQRFFRRYVMLSGMSGTVREVARELWNVYGLEVAAIPTHHPPRRQVLRDRIFPDEARKFEALVTYVSALHAAGVPVLIGCRTVAGSRMASARLDAAGLPHEVLHADEEPREAAIVALAGEWGRITVATNMAGRGTDIALGPGVAALGGLHVVMTERHDARRIDRQLEGRCARQGDPGVFIAMLSAEDRLIFQIRPRAFGWLCRRLVALAPGIAGRWTIRLAQVQLERRHSRVREELLRGDQAQTDLLALAGLPE